jgi:hypothetical protein
MTPAVKLMTRALYFLVGYDSLQSGGYRRFHLTDRKECQTNSSNNQNLLLLLPAGRLLEIIACEDELSTLFRNNSVHTASRSSRQYSSYPPTWEPQIQFLLVFAKFPFRISMRIRLIQSIQFTGLFNVQIILSADTGISRQTEGNYLSSESVRVMPSSFIEASIVLRSVSLWLVWVNVQSACAKNTRYLLNSFVVFLSSFIKLRHNTSN